MTVQQIPNMPDLFQGGCTQFVALTPEGGVGCLCVGREYIEHGQQISLFDCKFCKCPWIPQLFKWRLEVGGDGQEGGNAECLCQALQFISSQEQSRYGRMQGQFCHL